MVFDGDGFILQMQRVFTRIRSGTAPEVSSGDARGSTADSWLDLFRVATNAGDEKP
jgi:hypothetical protein